MVILDLQLHDIVIGALRLRNESEAIRVCSCVRVCVCIFESRDILVSQRSTTLAVAIVTMTPVRSV